MFPSYHSSRLCLCIYLRTELTRADPSHALQILSTLLTFLKEHDFSYDTLLVYTCVDNCEIPSREGGRSGWAEEWLAEHKFSEAGVDFGKPE